MVNAGLPTSATGSIFDLFVIDILAIVAAIASTGRSLAVILYFGMTWRPICLWLLLMLMLTHTVHIAMQLSGYSPQNKIQQVAPEHAKHDKYNNDGKKEVGHAFVLNGLGTDYVRCKSSESNHHPGRQ